MESDWYDLVSCLIEMIIKRMIEIRASEGIWATVLSKIASAKEEGSDDPGVLLLGQWGDRRSVVCLKRRGGGQRRVS